VNRQYPKEIEDLLASTQSEETRELIHTLWAEHEEENEKIRAETALYLIEAEHLKTETARIKAETAAMNQETVVLLKNARRMRVENFFLKIQITWLKLLVWFTKTLFGQE
jgi:hypothetical protein